MSSSSTCPIGPSIVISIGSLMCATSANTTARGCTQFVSLKGTHASCWPVWFLSIRAYRIKTGESYAKDSRTASGSLSCLPRRRHIPTPTSAQRMASRSHPLSLNVHFPRVYTVFRSSMYISLLERAAPEQSVRLGHPPLRKKWCRLFSKQRLSSGNANIRPRRQRLRGSKERLHVAVR